MLYNGAEARVSELEWNGRKIICKERLVKRYRHADLDKEITRSRMLQETRNAWRLRGAGVDTPFIYFADLPARKIYYEFVDGETMQTAFDSLTEEELRAACHAVGESLGKMHEKNLVHGDLTTANIMLRKASGGRLSTEKPCIIDLGLSYTSAQVEDKAVDIFVLKKAFLSAHGPHRVGLFDEILDGYSRTGETAAEVIARLEVVEQRGRKRSMVG